MFWDCFFYDKKDSCHCWLPETAVEKTQSLKNIEALNTELEPSFSKEEMRIEKWNEMIQSSSIIQCQIYMKMK